MWQNDCIYNTCIIRGKRFGFSISKSHIQAITHAKHYTKLAYNIFKYWCSFMHHTNYASERPPWHEFIMFLSCTERTIAGRHIQYAMENIIMFQ